MLRTNGIARAPAVLPRGDLSMRGHRDVVRLGRALDARTDNPFAKLPLHERRRLLSNVRAVGQRPTKGPDGVPSVLIRLATAGGKSRGAVQVASEAFLALKEHLAKTDDAIARRQALSALWERRAELPAKVKKELLAELEAAVPSRPPYEAWDGPDGVRRTKIALQCQDEFFPDWVEHLGGRLGFELVEDKDKKKTYVMRGEHEGKQTELTIVLEEKDGEMFAPMADPDVGVVVWCGHSDWWARVTNDLQKAPPQNGPKVFLNFMCFGRHFMHDVLSVYPKTHVVTSKDPTEDIEDQSAFKLILDGFVRGESWKTIAGAVKADKHNPDDNFVFPSDLPDLGFVLDSDGDGIVDLLDTVFDKTPPERLASRLSAADFEPRQPGKQRRPSGVFEAALLLNSVSYDHELFDQVNIEQRFRADGYFKGRDEQQRVLRLEDAVVHKKRVIRMQVDERYAHSHPAAIVGMAMVEGTLAMLARVRPKIPPADRIMHAIAVLAHVTDNDRYPHGADVYKRTLAHYGLPQLKRREVIAAVAAHPKWESGSKRTAKAMRAIVTPAQLARIEDAARRLI